MAEVQFNAAVNVIRSLPKDGPFQPSHDMMLKFYGLYKQATEGMCSEPKPAFYDLVRGYKWRAWKNYEQMSKEEAMATYVEELKKIIETMSYTENVANFMEVSGPIYEYAEILGYKKLENNNLEKKVDSKSHQSSSDNFPSPVNGSRSTPPTESEIEGLSDYSFLNGDVSPELSPVDNEIQEKLEKPSPKSEEVVLNDSFFTTKKFQSDTDSDEEYSEPAETPDSMLVEETTFLSQKESANITIDHNKQMYVAYHSNISEGSDHTLQASSVDILTCAGGDLTESSHPRFSGYRQAEGGGMQSRGMPPMSPSSSLPRSRHGGRSNRRRSGGSGYSETTGGAVSGVNTQLILILQKIHEDLQAVLLRLDRLESQALQTHRDGCEVCKRREISSQSGWWPFPELSPRSTFFLLTWPLILHGGIKALIFLRSRRKRKI